MQSPLDKVDLPAGVEASFPWLKDSVSTENMAFALSTSTFQDVAEIKRIVTIPDLADGKRKGTIPRSADGEVTPTFRSASSALGESSFKEKEADGVMERFQCFKQFDIVDDFLDHHFKREGLKGQQPCSNWAKKI